jgi:LCP family protein required for cell wall assembly
MRNKAKRKKYIYIALGILSVVVISGTILIAQKWNQPISSGYDLPTYIPTKTTTKAAISTISLNTPKIPIHTPTKEFLQDIKLTSTFTPLPSSQPTPVPLCGGPAVMTILALGIDSQAVNYFYGLADVIRIVKIDFVSPKVTILSLPRDLWVEIPEISDHYGITHGKLNQAYLYGTEGMGYYDGPGQGAGLMALTLAHNFDLYVDQYSSVNMTTMAEIIDAIGGIEIYLEEGVYDTLENEKIELSAGHHHLTGKQAILLARTRRQDSDLNRIDRQTQVLYALQEKILSPTVIQQIPKLISTFQDSVITDLSPKNLATLTCLAPNITKEKLVFASIPEELLDEDRQYDPHRKTNVWVFNADFDVLRSLLDDFQRGDWPEN